MWTFIMQQLLENMIGEVGLFWSTRAEIDGTLVPIIN